MSNSDGLIRSYVDRILRLKDEVKAINDDIREVYAEAKGEGFDKTALGKLVNYVERRNKDAAAVAESEAIFELYLSAYYGTGTPVATHAHASEGVDTIDTPDHDPATGEVIEHHEAGNPVSDQSTAARKDVPIVTAGTQAPPVEPEAEAAGRQEPDPQWSGSATREDAETAASVPIGSNERAVTGIGPESTADAGRVLQGDAPDVASAAHPEAGAPAGEDQAPADASPVPQRKWKYSDKPHSDCLNPDLCGGNSNYARCQTCAEAAANMQVA